MRTLCLDHEAYMKRAAADARVSARALAWLVPHGGATARIIMY